MAQKLTGKALRDRIEGITQRGESVPGGYTFDPRQDPALFATEVVNRPSNVASPNEGDAGEGEDDDGDDSGQE